MYSLVLMAALTNGGDAASFGGKSGCYGCDGFSCSGYSCSGYSCTGYSCSGCKGGGFFGGLFSRGKSCHGGCYGSSYGCDGGSCHGYSCSGYSCHGSSCKGGGFFGGLFNRGKGCHGSCHGSCYGGCVGGCIGYDAVPAAPAVTPAPAPAAPAEKMPAPPAAKPAGQASLKLTVPAAARVFVDGRLTTAEGTERVFETPALEAGQLYYYEVKAELEVAGSLVVESKRVIVKAGAEVQESFPKLTAAVQVAAAN